MRSLIITRSFLRITIAFVVCAATLVHAFPAWAQLSATPIPKSTSLLVSFTAPPEEIGKVPITLSSALGRTDLDARTLARLNSLGIPAKIESMIRDRVPENLLDKLSVLHPERLLHNFVVVTYDSTAAAENQLAHLRRESGILDAEFNYPVMPHYWPGWEPYYSQWYPFERDYQWGMLALRTFEAWDIAPGWGYVGVVDSGIATAHEEFDSSFAQQFAVNHTVLPGDPNRNNVDEERNPPISNPKGHGTHVAGIIAANVWNHAGVTGICLECVMLIEKYVSYGDATHPTLGGATSNVVNGVVQAIRNGAQVVNMSFGIDEAAFECASDPMNLWCLTADYARRRAVVLVASAGNGNSGTLQMPAVLNEYLPVGGLMVYASNAIDNWAYWKPWGNGSSNPCPECGTNFSSTAPQRVVMAPARNVVSSVYPGVDWNFTCGQSSHGEHLADAGYGLCTGTSMAAPHISGMLAVMRSVNPLKSDAEVRQVLLNSSAVPNFATPPYSEPTLYSAWDKDAARWGAGVPNMRMAVDSMVAGNPSRLTPLFSMYSSGAENYFYTAVPQMAVAATQGGLLPNSGTLWWDIYSPTGSTINEYPSFPENLGFTPRAQIWVFTTPQNPKDPSIAMVPLYRFSWRCTTCQNPNHVDHGYSTTYSEFAAFFSNGYSYDGMEGYIYPPNGPQYLGTEAVYRSFNPTRMDYAIYPSSLYASMMNEGYTLYLAHLGWAYPNAGPRPVIQ